MWNSIRNIKFNKLLLFHDQNKISNQSQAFFNTIFEKISKYIGKSYVKNISSLVGTRKVALWTFANQRPWPLAVCNRPVFGVSREGEQTHKIFPDNLCVEFNHRSTIILTILHKTERKFKSMCAYTNVWNILGYTL